MIPEPGIPSPEVQRLTQALDNAGVRPKCPICERGNAWIPFEDPSIVLGSKSMQGLMVVALMCDYCGFVRYHTAQVLDKYIDPRTN